jgi:hypothetical protein
VVKWAPGWPTWHCSWGNEKWTLMWMPDHVSGGGERMVIMASQSTWLTLKFLMNLYPSGPVLELTFSTSQASRKKRSDSWLTSANSHMLLQSTFMKHWVSSMYILKITVWSTSFLVVCCDALQLWLSGTQGDSTFQPERQ